MDITKPLTSYTYNPLERPESIRILALQPAAAFSAPLAGSLLHDDRELILNDLTDTRQYETVSYAWGEPVFTHWITLDGTTHLNCTANVDSMLRHLRKPHRQVRLWVDAICLNQKDAGEKRVQVQLMGEIYQYARKLHIWLGSGDNQDAVAVFHHLQHATSAARLAKRKQPSILTQVPWSSVQRLLRLPWFQRRWVVQEVELSSDITVHWTAKKLVWNMFLTGLQQLKASEEKGLDLISQKVLDAVCDLGKTPSTMLELLWTHHRAICLDPRDRLYSLFSLANDVTDFTPDQARSASVLSRSAIDNQLFDYTCHWQSIYVRFAKMCLARGHFQELLAHCCAFKSLSRNDINHPSWVPDWSIARHDGTLAAANSGTREIDFPTLSTSVLLQGKISIDCQEYYVQDVFGGWSPSTGSDQIQTELEAITRACHRRGTHPAKLLKMGISNGIFKDDFRAMRRSLANSWLEPETSGFDDTDMHAFVYAMSKHQFYVCVDGNVGFGPTTLKAQDMIVRSREGHNHFDPLFQLIGRESMAFGSCPLRKDYGVILV
ncbi:HET-domain-containing protein [Venturia nashicola]|nr:HET-domain-containing protein [Venturia nashicola]